MIFLGLVSMGVRVFTNRCGTSPNWVFAVAVVTIVACLMAWLMADGPLYNEVKVRIEKKIREHWYCSHLGHIVIYLSTDRSSTYRSSSSSRAGAGCERLSRIFIVQILPRKHGGATAVDRADYSGLTRQHMSYSTSFKIGYTSALKCLLYIMNSDNRLPVRAVPRCTLFWFSPVSRLKKLVGIRGGGGGGVSVGGI